MEKNTGKTMNGFILRTAASCLAAVLVVGAVGCGRRNEPEEGESRTDAYFDVTVPTLPEEREPTPVVRREPTSVSAYRERLEQAFASVPETPADRFLFRSESDGSITITGFQGTETVVRVPEQIGQHPVTGIAEKAFAGHGTLKAVSLPSGVTTVGFGALEGCTNLVTLLTPVITCGESHPYFGALFGVPFRGDDQRASDTPSIPASLTDLIVTNGTTVPEAAFYGCRNLEAVSLPPSLTSIGELAFFDCVSLTFVDVPETGLRGIGKHAFHGCQSLLHLTVPHTVSVMGPAILEGCSSLETLTLPFIGGSDGENAYLGYLFGSPSFEVNAGFVPKSLFSLTVTGGATWPEFALYDCRSLLYVTLPETVTAIGRFAFYGCESLQTVNTADVPVQTVGDHAFSGCRTLVTLELPPTVTAIGSSVLENCGSLERLTIPFVGGGQDDNAYTGYLFGASDYTFTEGYVPASLSEVTVLGGRDIPANAFFGCRFVRTVHLPAGLTAIGHRAFYGCETLTEIHLPETVTTVSDDAFHGCIRLTTVTGGEGLCTLGVQAFMDCLSLVSVILPSGVTAIPNACFSGCISLETVTAPAVTEVGAQAFRHCLRLTGWETDSSAGE